MDIQTHFTLSETEYIEAQDLYVREKTKPSRKILVWISVVFLCFVLCVTAIGQIAGHQAHDIVSIATPIAFLLLIFAAVPWLRKRNFKQRYKLEAPNLSNVRLRLTDETYESAIPGVGDGRAAWSAFNPWMEGPHVFILINAFTFRPIPKSSLTAREITELREFLASNVPSAKRPRKLIN